MVSAAQASLICYEIKTVEEKVTKQNMFYYHLKQYINHVLNENVIFVNLTK
jgi:hypothetical protein